MFTSDISEIENRVFKIENIDTSQEIKKDSSKKFEYRYVQIKRQTYKYDLRGHELI